MGTTHNGPVCLEDLAPTITEMAGATPPAGMDGKSLVPILRGEPSPVVAPDISSNPHTEGESTAVR